MKPKTVLLLSVQGAAALALAIVAVSGDASLQPNGLHVAKLAYDNIALTVLAACILSCVLAPILLASVTESWLRAEAIGLFGAIVVGLLAASAFANAREMTLNGASTGWISWPAMLWLFALLAIFALRACDAHHIVTEPNRHANPNSPTAGSRT